MALTINDQVKGRTKDQGSIKTRNQEEKIDRSKIGSKKENWRSNQLQTLENEKGLRAIWRVMKMRAGASFSNPVIVMRDGREIVSWRGHACIQP